MNDYDSLFDAGESGSNPYSVAPVTNISMAETQRHDSGNAIAANSEARAIAEVKAQVLMARQFPRDSCLSTERILRECERPTLAEKATYSYPRGKEMVTGPSIRLAEVLARNWGNCTCGVEVLERKSGTGKSAGISVIRAYAWDLETNTYVARQFEVKHWRGTRSGGYALTDDRDIYELEANMAARRMRACILQIIPGDVTQASVNKCRMTLSNGLSNAMNDPKQRSDMLTKTIRIFAKMGVSQEDLEKFLDTRIQDWTADHALRLKELKNSLDEGVVRIGDVFPHLAAADQNETITREQTAELMKLAAGAGKQGDVNVSLKQMGIAKIADIPAVRYGEVKAMIEAIVREVEKKKAEEEKADTVPPPAATETPSDNAMQEHLPWEV